MRKNIKFVFLPNLVQLVDNITSDHSKYHPVTQHYKDMRKFRIWMVIALLCVTMNPNCCFFQTLIRLICYASGLRGKRFEVFNTHGCTCSIDHLKNHGAFWANKHKAVICTTSCSVSLPLQRQSKDWRQPL